MSCPVLRDDLPVPERLKLVAAWMDKMADDLIRVASELDAMAGGERDDRA